MSRALWCVVNGRAAAPPAMACSVGPSTSTNRSPASVLRIDWTIFVRRRNRSSDALGVDQVEVAHPLAQLGIAAGPCAWPAASRSTCERKCSCSAKMVSSPVFVRRSSPSTPMMSPRSKHCGQFPVRLAHLVLADEELDLAGPVADVDEDQLARLALAGRCVRPRGPWARAARAACPSAQSPTGSTTISFSRARISPIGWWSSNRPPQGSTPSSTGSFRAFRVGPPRASPPPTDRLVSWSSSCGGWSFGGMAAF